MACYDIRGWQVLELARQIGVVVFDEIAVIGVDDDELLCNLLGAAALRPQLNSRHRLRRRAARPDDGRPNRGRRVPSATCRRLVSSPAIERRAGDPAIRKCRRPCDSSASTPARNQGRGGRCARPPFLRLPGKPLQKSCLAIRPTTKSFACSSSAKQLLAENRFVTPRDFLNGPASNTSNTFSAVFKMASSAAHHATFGNRADPGTG